MLNTEGFTPEGIERKATCQNLFRKLLFLTEYEPLTKQGGGAAVSADLRKVRVCLWGGADGKVCPSVCDTRNGRCTTQAAANTSIHASPQGASLSHDPAQPAQIFGATDEDQNNLRIVSLFDVDLEKAFGKQVRPVLRCCMAAATGWHMPRLWVRGALLLCA